MRSKSTIAFKIALVVFIVSVVLLGLIGYQYWVQDKAYQEAQEHFDVSDVEDNYLNAKVDWDALRQENEDIVAWVFVPETKINYPVVQGDDNEEYLDKAFNGNEGLLGSAGTVFLDSSNSPDFSDKNNAIYGHHMNDGSMFACIAEWVDSKEFNENRIIYLYTPTANYLLTTFSVIKTTGDDPIVQTTFASDEEYTKYIQAKIDRSAVPQKVQKIKAEDVEKSFMFCTCEYSQNDGRIIVYASVTKTAIQS
ncbi:MAG: class B sortase [Anaerotardibacter sp.]